MTLRIAIQLFQVFASEFVFRINLQSPFEMRPCLFQVSGLRQGATHVRFGVCILWIQPYCSAEVQERSLEVALRSQRTPQVIVSIEVIRSPRERGFNNRWLRPRGRSPK